ncbi:MAG: hypothetical protein CMN03_02980 [Roseibacillus sp.]|nr:hypothetical protein [Roseibacillus sp.]
MTDLPWWKAVNFNRMTDNYLDLPPVVRWLGRAGSDVRNISEKAVFVAAATDMRHATELPEVE